MNNTLRNLVRCALPAIMLTVSSMAMSQEANAEDTKRITPVQMEAREVGIAQSETKPVIKEQSGFCYQGNELISCEGAAPARHETKSEGSVPPPPMFDLNVLLGGNAP